MFVQPPTEVVKSASVILALSTNGALELTAYATLVLAVVTGGLAVGTFFSVRLGKAALAQTQKDIELQRQEVEEAHRPVVIPVVSARPSVVTSDSQSRHTAVARPSLVEHGVLAVPIQNIGSGPALRVRASIRRLNEDGEPWTGGATEPQTPGTTAGLGQEAVLPIEIRAHGWEEWWD